MTTKIKQKNGNRAVSDTGPIIHLTEINLIKVFDIFSAVLIPEEVERELKNSKIQKIFFTSHLTDNIDSDDDNIIYNYDPIEDDDGYDSF